MSFEKISAVNLIEVLQNGVVQVRTELAIMEDGVKISSNFHRSVILPGANFDNEDARVKAICAVVHTPEVVAQYTQSLE